MWGGVTTSMPKWPLGFVRSADPILSLLTDGRSTGKRTLLPGRARAATKRRPAWPDGRNCWPPWTPVALAKPGAANMWPAAPSSAPATAATPATGPIITGTSWAGFTGTPTTAMRYITIAPGKAVPGRPPARKPSAAPAVRGQRNPFPPILPPFPPILQRCSG